MQLIMTARGYLWFAMTLSGVPTEGDVRQYVLRGAMTNQFAVERSIEAVDVGIVTREEMDGKGACLRLLLASVLSLGIACCCLDGDGELTDGTRASRPLPLCDPSLSRGDCGQQPVEDRRAPHPV